MKVVLIKRVIVCLFLFAAIIPANAQVWDWVETIRPGGNEYCWDIATDIGGNVLATGRVKATSTFGSGTYSQTPPFISCCETDIFIAKYASNGRLLWVNRDGGVQPDWGRAVTSDKEGNVFVTGDYCDTARFGLQHANPKMVIALGSPTNRNAFLVKYDSAGNCMWVRTVGNKVKDAKGYGIATDEEGNSYMTGYIGDTASLDGISFGSFGRSSCFVAKFDKTGKCKWVKNIVGYYGSEGNDVKISEKQELVVVGGYKGTLYVGNNTYQGNSSTWPDVFITKMDLEGNFIWTKTAIGQFRDQANSVDFDSKGNIYVAGTFANELIFGSTTLKSLGAAPDAATANSRADIFLAKCNAAGEFQWAKAIRNSSKGHADPYDVSQDGIVITPTDKVIISGYIIGATEIDGVLMELDTANETGYIVAFDVLGKVAWYKLAGGDPKNNAGAAMRGISADKYGNIFTGGEFYSTTGAMNLDSIKIKSLNGWDAFIGKLYPPLSPSITVNDTIICRGGSIQFQAVQEGYPLHYNWYFPGGTPLSSQLANPLVTYDSIGEYEAMLVVSNGHSSDTVSQKIKTTVCTAIEKQQLQANVTISPNPVAGISEIRVSDVDLVIPVYFKLYNMVGEQIGNEIAFTGGSFKLNGDEYMAGTYIFVLTQNNKFLKTGKLVLLNR